MSKYTPLDTLIDTVLRVSNTIGIVSENLVEGQHPTIDEDGREVALLDMAKRDLWSALAAHVQGLGDEHAQILAGGNPAAWRYSDGSPVAEVIELEPGHITVYYPRYDGLRSEHVANVNSLRKPPLRLVPKE